MAKPKKSEAGIPVSIRLPQEAHEAATRAAEEDARTLNSYVVKAVLEKLERDKKAAR